MPKTIEAFEKWGAGGAGGEDGSEEHEVLLDRPFFGSAEGSEGGVEGLYCPLGGFEGGELIGGEGQCLFEGALFGDEELGGGEDFVAEEEVGEVAELAEGLDAGLDERGDLAEVVVGEEGGAEAVVEGCRARGRGCTRR